MTDQPAANHATEVIEWLDRGEVGIIVFYCSDGSKRTLSYRTEALKIEKIKEVMKKLDAECAK